MKSSLRLFLLVLVAAGLLSVPAQALAATATVRVEGASSTLVHVSASTAGLPVSKNGNPPCVANSGADLLEVATGGSWTGPYFDGFGYSVETIKGETHTFSSEAFWALWVNNVESQVGICGYTPSSGDEVLLFPAPTACFPACTFPTEVTGVPNGVTAGQSGVVRAVRYQPDGTPAAAAGATIEVRQGSTVEVAQANSSGEATFTFPTAGTWEAQVRSTSGFVRSEAASFTVAAPTASGGGTTAPPTTTPPGTTAPGATTPGTTTPGTTTPGTTAGTTSGPAPRSIATSQFNITGTVGRRRRFTNRGAPFRLSAVLDADPRSIRQVKFRLGRRLGNRCWFFSGSEERLRANSCRRSTPWFRVSLADATEVLGGGIRFEQRLDGRLPRGRYVFDVKVQGLDGRYTALERGRTREVFFVGVPAFRVGF